MVDPEIFYYKLKEERESCNFNSTTMSKSKYDNLINKVKSVKEKQRKEGNDYRFLKRYGLLQIDGIEKLVSVNSINTDCVKYFLHDDDLFNILNETHLSTNHGGRDRMINILKNKYKNVTYKDIMLYLRLCEICLQKQKKQKKCLVTKPKIYLDLNSKCQIDIINYELQPDGDYKFILMYQDYQTKFIILKPLKTISVEEICDNIIDIFTIFGAPLILKSINGKAIADKLIDTLKNVWPNFKLVYGDPEYVQNYGNIESKPYDDIKQLINAWMNDNGTKHWTKALRFVQLMKNSTFNNTMNKSPYESLFGCAPKNGLGSCGFSPEVLENINSENDLENFIKITNMQEESQIIENENDNIIKEESLNEEIVVDQNNYKQDEKEVIKSELEEIIPQRKRLSDECSAFPKNQEKKVKYTTNCIEPETYDDHRGATSVLEVVFKTENDSTTLKEETEC